MKFQRSGSYPMKHFETFLIKYSYPLVPHANSNNRWLSNLLLANLTFKTIVWKFSKNSIASEGHKNGNRFHYSSGSIS